MGRRKYNKNPNSYGGQVLQPSTARWRYISLHCLQTSKRYSPICPSDKIIIKVSSTRSMHLQLTEKPKNSEEHIPVPFVYQNTIVHFPADRREIDLRLGSRAYGPVSPRP